MGDKPVMVACIPAYNEDRTVGSLVRGIEILLTGSWSATVGSRGLTGEIAEAPCFYVSSSVISFGGGYVW